MKKKKSRKKDPVHIAAGKMARRKGGKWERRGVKNIIDYFNDLGVKGVSFKYGVDAERPDRYKGKEKLDMAVHNPLLQLLFPFLVEFKHREDWDLMQIFNRNRMDIENWSMVKYLRISQKRIKDGSRCPIVIFTRNNAPSFVLFSKDDIEERLGEFYNTRVCEAIESCDIPYPTPHDMQNAFRMVLFCSDEDSYCIMDFDGFMEMIAPKKEVVQLKNRWNKLKNRDKEEA